jgi:hypothetical protein
VSEMPTHTIVFLSFAGGLFLLGCLWDWLQGTAAYAGNDSDGGTALWVFSIIALIAGVASGPAWLLATFGSLFLLVIIGLLLRAIFRHFRDLKNKTRLIRKEGEV